MKNKAQWKTIEAINFVTINWKFVISRPHRTYFKVHPNWCLAELLLVASKQNVALL